MNCPKEQSDLIRMLLLLDEITEFWGEEDNVKGILVRLVQKSRVVEVVCKFYFSKEVKKFFTFPMNERLTVFHAHICTPVCTNRGTLGRKRKPGPVTWKLFLALPQRRRPLHCNKKHYWTYGNHAKRYAACSFNVILMYHLKGTVIILEENTWFDSLFVIEKSVSKILVNLRFWSNRNAHGFCEVRKVIFMVAYGTPVRFAFNLLFCSIIVSKRL